jgi:hypothetical protein
VPIEEDLIGEDITNLSSDTGKLIFGIIRRGRLVLSRPGLDIRLGDEMVLADRV